MLQAWGAVESGRREDEDRLAAGWASCEREGSGSSCEEEPTLGCCEGKGGPVMGECPKGKKPFRFGEEGDHCRGGEEGREASYGRGG